MSDRHIACAVEDTYVPHSAAMLHSALTSGAARGCTIHYLHTADVGARQRRRLGAMVTKLGAEISFLAVPDELVAGLETGDFTRKATWYRILLPELLRDVDRVLFLDVDTIVTDSLAPLWETDLSDHYLAAVTNVPSEEYMDRPAALGLPDPAAYFNAGVLLMNLGLMRRDGCTQKLRAFGTAQRPTLRDQDTLNAVLSERRLELHPRWNCMSSFWLYEWSADLLGAEAVAEARRRPAIRHFEGPSVGKPWHFLCDRPMRELYGRHRRRTPWPVYMPEGATPRNLLGRLRRAVRHRASL